jgi:hypothetical protein
MIANAEAAAEMVRSVAVLWAIAPDDFLAMRRKWIR